MADDRLSIAQCRHLIPERSPNATNLSDAELVDLRDGMYSLATTLVEAHEDFLTKAEDLNLDTVVPVDLVLASLRQQFENEGDDWAEEDFPLDDLVVEED